MAFEYINDHEREVECGFPKPIGAIIVKAGEAIPTPEHEEMGISVALLKREGFLCKNLFTTTPLAVRRSLLEKAGLSVSEAIILATANHPDYLPPHNPVKEAMLKGSKTKPSLAPVEPPAVQAAQRPALVTESLVDKPLSGLSEGLDPEVLATLADLRQVKSDIEKTAEDDRDALTKNSIDEFQERVDASCSSWKKGKKMPENPE